MADLSAKSAKKKKRKLSSQQEEIRPTKAHRIDLPENKPAEVELEVEQDQKVEEGLPWKNLKLILSIQNKDIDLQKKLEIVFSFVNSRVKGGETEENEEYETVKTSRLVVFLSDWVQSLLISTEKKGKVDGGRNQSGVVEACLDFRCWVIFKFCLEESLNRQVSLNISRNLLRAIGCIARNALSLLNENSSGSKESFSVGEGYELYSVVLDCLSLVFSSEGGLLNENLDLWISTVDPILQLVLKSHSQKSDGGCADAFFLQFSCLVLEPFAKFLRTHPTRKNGFRDFVVKLLEPLLHLLGILHSDQTRNLLTLVEEVLSNGLFHPAHIDGFLGLRGTEKYLAFHEGKSAVMKTDVKSYHRHLFDKLESIMTAEKVSVVSGVGQLFHLFVARVSKQKGVSVSSGNAKSAGKNGASMQLEKNVSGHVSEDSFGSSSALPHKSYSASNLNAETRKALFEFFIQIMEPLLFKMNGYVQAKLVHGPALLDAPCILKAINSLLSSFVCEKVYVRTEDISKGACFNFLTEVHDAVMSFAASLPLLSNCDLAHETQKEMFIFLARELLIAVGYLLDIEYQVIGNDLESLWLMMLSYLAIGLSSVDAPDQCLLTTQILDLGCQLVNLYSELRQVNNVVFALCKAVRFLISCDNNGETSYTRFLSGKNSLPCQVYAKSVEMLLCSQDFKFSIHTAIRSIPEGQGSGCIRQLTSDISESLKWMKGSCAVADGTKFNNMKASNYGIPGFDLQAELLGRDLSELYVLVLDSLIVTTGNSNLVGLSIKDLVTVICPFISGLVQLQVESVNEFLFSVTGRTFKNGMAEKNNDLLKCGLSTKWIFVFFFRLYVSCRSLFRQAISLMPPDSSKKMSAAMGDSLNVYSGRDWMEKTDWTDEGYFSWVVQPSNSLINVINFFLEIYIKDDVAECSPLIYVLLTMALQRLVDLNRQIKSLTYLLQNNENAVQFNLLGKSDLSQYRKKCKKCRKHLSVLNEEAADLTEFMMGYISLVENMYPVISSSDDVSCENKCVQELHASDEWNMGVCAVDGNSLPTAIWWIVSQNIDIWCIHAAPKKLKLFLSVLIHTSCSCVTSNFSSVGKHSINEDGHLKGVTVHQISSELLRDSFLYEHKFVRRHLASRFCHLLEQSALPLFSDISIRDVDFHTSPDWITVLSELGNSSLVVSGAKNFSSDSISVAKSVSYSLDKLPTTDCKGKKAVTSMKFTACQSLLNLLCWMPKTYMNSKSFSLSMTCILNLERIVVGCLLKCQNALFSCSFNDFFKLLVSCRRTLKYIIIASCEERTEGSQSSQISMLSEGSNFVLWLFKSVFLVIGLQEALSDDCSGEISDMIFSLIDHTSYIFLALSKHLLNSAIASVILFDKPCKGKPSSEVSYEQNNLKESGPCLDSFKEFEAWKRMFLVMESLQEQAQSLLVSLKDALCDRKVGVCSKVVYLNKLSSLVSCISGILWGLASAANHCDEKNGDKVKLLRWKCEPISTLNHYIDLFADVTCSFLNILVVEEDQSFQKLDYCKDPPGSWEFLLGRSNARTENLGTLRICEESIGIDEDSRMTVVHDNRSKLEDANSSATVLAKNDLLELQRFNRHLLHGLLKGNHPEAAFSLRQLFIASSAILRLKLQRSTTPFSSGLVPTFVGISEFLLLQLADMIEVPLPFTFVWLDGVLSYLEELGNHFPLTNPMLTRNVYTKLIELHLRAIGKCIYLQGKKATLASHETESSTKILDCSLDLSEAFLSHGPYCLDEFKARLRMSFKVFIKKPSDLHLLSAVKAIERSLVGVQEGSLVTYNISTGSGDGGKVSSIVAAGIDCLDLVLEYVSGRKRLGVIKRHMQNFIAALFNIVVHLQSPSIFYGKPIRNDGSNGPDPGSVILMCIEVLTRISGKHALFQMDSWHVAQSMRIPAALFEDIRQPRHPQAPVPSPSAMYSDKQESKNVASMNSWAVDRKFSINLFAACCKLLYTILKHHKSECEQCIVLLEESVRVLIHCLETVDTELEVRKGYFSWDIQEGVKCASFLRRIYEELRQQKDVFGRHCFKFLSNYVWVYSGYGLLKTGIRREIDEALKPGVYALIDACSADDLQYLHTVFGEGPCRNTLATLQQDYKLNFRYEGKV